MSTAADLTGRNVIVTGAAGNMGAAVCEALADAGANVWALDRPSDALGALPTRLGPAVQSVVCDLRDPFDVDRCFDAGNPLWGLVHTVGGWRGGTLSSSLPEDLTSMLSLNLTTTFLAVRSALRRMLDLDGGRIVAIGSIDAALGTGVGGAALYNASKAAVITLIKAADEEGRSRNVRAACLAPTTLDTPQNRAAMPTADPAQWVPLSEVADAVLACMRPSSGLGGSVLTLPGRAPRS